MKTIMIICALVVPLSACISLGSKAPPSLLTLTPAAMIAANDIRSAVAGDSISVAIPTTPQSIATTRVAVSTGATEIAYIKDAAWVEAPARLFQRMLAETIALKTGKVVIDARQLTPEPGVQITGQLIRFGINADANEAIITYDAVMVRGKNGGMTTRRFEARVPVGAIEASAAGRALNQAANQIALDVAAWIGR